jgi:6-phosphogluconolactonase (cycloisomerase 2 family)
VTVDPSGRFVLFTHNIPSGVTVHRLNPDGTIGGRVTQPAPLDPGVFAHQCLVDPSGTVAVLVARGNGPEPGKAEDPGALRILKFADGVLTSLASVAPGGGFGFQPRHVDFDPRLPWMFVSVERQNTLQVYRRRADGVPEPMPVFSTSTLMDRSHARPEQVAGAVHVHPSGRHVYVANRAGGTVAADGTAVFAGGENSIAVFGVDGRTGEPTAIQHADTRGFVPRTFALDPEGRVLVAANQVAMAVLAEGRVVTTPASLALFRVGADGRLDFVRTYGVDTASAQSLFWVGVVSWSR